MATAKEKERDRRLAALAGAAVGGAVSEIVDGALGVAGIGPAGRGTTKLAIGTGVVFGPDQSMASVEGAGLGMTGAGMQQLTAVGFSALAKWKAGRLVFGSAVPDKK